MTKQIEKPPIKDEEIVVKIWEMAQSSMKLGYDAYKDNIVRQNTLKWALKAIQQARAEVAREIIREVEKLWKPQHHNLCYGVIQPHPDCVCCKWLFLKSKYMEGK